MPLDLSVIPYSIDLGMEILNALIRFMNWDGLKLPAFYIGLYRRLRNWFLGFLHNNMGRLAQSRRGQLPGWVRDDLGRLVREVRHIAPSADREVHRFDRRGDDYVEYYQNDSDSDSDDYDDYRYRRY